MTAIKRFICKLWHSRVAYAGGAAYRCRTCGQEYAAPWAPEVK